MNKKKILKSIIFIIVISFMFFYFTSKSGYYEYSLKRKTNLTNEAISQFEKDISEGKEVDITSYLENTTIDYSNNITRTTSNINLKLNEYLKNILVNGFSIFDKLFK